MILRGCRTLHICGGLPAFDGEETLAGSHRFIGMLGLWELADCGVWSRSDGNGVIKINPSSLKRTECTSSS